jgi:MYXO-CTERM domain-containing protein
LQKKSEGTATGRTLDKRLCRVGFLTLLDLFCCSLEYSQRIKLMSPLHRIIVYIVPLVVTAVGIGSVLGETVTIVPYYENKEAPGYYHFNPVSGPDVERDQMMMDGSLFSGPGGPVFIDSVAFRLDKSATSTSASLTDLQIRLSTAATTVGSMSTTLADNVGVDVTTMYSGPLTLSSPGGAAAPSAFDILIPFLVPFTYEPLAGDLLFDWEWTGNFNNRNFRLDTNYGNAGSYTGVVNFMEDSQPQDGFAEFTYPGLSVIAQFSVTPVNPEPSAVLLALLGLALLPLRRRRNFPQKFP